MLGVSTIDSLLKAIAKEEEFSTYEIQIARGSINGDGYAGIINSVCINGKDKTNKCKTLNLIVKSAPTSDALRDNISIASIYEREIFMYEKIFSAFKSFELEKGLPVSNFAPEFYKASLTNKNEALVLENLRTSGYVLHERKIPMNEEHVSLVFTKYAQLHALSYVMRDQAKEKFEMLASSIANDTLIGSLKEKFLDSITSCFKKATRSLNQKFEKHIIEAHQKVFDEIPAFLESIRGNVDEYSVILHGDCWCNNMMFKYDDPNCLTNPSDVRFLDFQVSTVGSPAMDLVYFYYVCSGKEALDKLDYYMELYHKTLSSHILKLGSNPEKLFPYNIFKEHWRRYAKFGLLMSSMAAQVALTEKDEAINLSEVVESKESLSNAFNYEISNVDLFNERVRNVILHFYNNNLL